MSYNHNNTNNNKSRDIFISTLIDSGIMIDTNTNSNTTNSNSNSNSSSTVPRLLQNSNRVLRKLTSSMKLMNKSNIEEFYNCLKDKLCLKGNGNVVEIIQQVYIYMCVYIAYL